MRHTIALCLLTLSLGLTGCTSDTTTPEPAVDDGASGPAAASGTGAMERVAADVGVAKQGRSLDGYTGGVEGAIAGKAKALFAFKENAAFNLQVKPALQLYKASHDNKGPATHEAFMKDIIEFNKIQLPELPQGHRYVYDPEKEMLMVERPQ